jgi:PAS domain S-box-containing protein
MFSAEQSLRLLNAINYVQQAFIRGIHSSEELFHFLLDTLLELTESEYGFIGKVLYNPDNQPYLKIFAITNIAWNEQTRRLYDENKESGLEFHNLKTLFGHVMTTGEPVIANQPKTDTRSGGLPEGHPAMHSFLGVPVHNAQYLTAMFGVANRPNGYNQSVIDFLNPFISTISVIVQGINQKQKETEYLDSLQKSLEQEHKLNEELAMIEEELRLSLEKVLLSEEKLRVVVENAIQGIAIMGVDKKLRFLDKNPRKILDFEIEEVKNLDVWRLIHSEDIPYCREMLKKTYENPAKVVQAVFRMKHKDGKWHWIEGQAINLLSNAFINGIVITWRDVSDRMLAEEKIAESESTLSAILESSMRSIVMLDKNRKIIYFNKKSNIALSSLQRAQLIKDADILEFVPAEFKESFLEAFEACLAGDARKFERKIIDPNNQNIWLEVYYYPAYNADNQIVGVCLSFLNISERKISEDKIQQQNEQLTEFAKLTSHQLRRPVASILGLISLFDFANLQTEFNADIIKNLVKVAQDLDKVIHQMNHLLD